MRDLAGRVAVVTGAASGIGSALARRAAAEGMAVAVADVDEGGLAALGEELLAAGARVLARRTDVSRAEDVEALADAAFAELGGAHLLFNNAGVLVTGASWEHPLEDWRWVLGVNVFGVIHGIRSFVPRMLAQGGPGHVVNTASVAGITSGPFMGPYAVSKHAVVALSETLHHEFVATGAPLRASVLCPGEVRTAIMDAERTRPAELASGTVPSALSEAVAKGFRETIARGMAPDEVASRVFDAVREERFWILTHPEFAALAEERVRGLVEGRAAVFRTFDPKEG